MLMHMYNSRLMLMHMQFTHGRELYQTFRCGGCGQVRLVSVMLDGKVLLCSMDMCV